MKKVATALLATLALAIPTASHAEHIKTECTGHVLAQVDPGTRSATCTVTFPLNDSDVNKRYVSLVGTGANMLDLGAKGKLTLEWIDAAGKTVVALGCDSTGVSLDGTTDQVSRTNCTQFGPTADTYRRGDQTLRVTAYLKAGDCPAAECTFHGKLNLSRNDDVY